MAKLKRLVRRFIVKLVANSCDQQVNAKMVQHQQQINNTTQMDKPTSGNSTESLTTIQSQSSVTESCKSTKVDCCQCSRGLCDRKKCDIFNCCYIIGHWSHSMSQSDMDEKSRPCSRSGSASHFAEMISYDCELAQLDHRTWLTSFSRKKAEEVLHDRPSGTFLVRPSSIPTKYALSVVVGRTIHHCLINEEDGNFGFVVPYEFPNLKSLVLHYTYHSLKRYNPKLRVKLDEPALKGLIEDTLREP